MSEEELTPYDTGERLEPAIWEPEPLIGNEPHEDFGKVDFDNEEGRTVLTVWVERTELGGYAMYVLEHGGGELDAILRGTGETLKRLREEG